MERVILGFSKEETAAKVRRMLEGTPFSVQAVCRTRAEVLRAAADTQAVVITGYKLPDGTVEELCADLPEGCPVMALMKAERQTEIRGGRVFCVPLPVNRAELHRALERLCGEADRKRHRKSRSPEERKLIEDAKRYLMEQHLMTEEEAHRFIQKRSMDTGASFLETASTILNQ